MPQKIVILGAGLFGLSAAIELKKRDSSINIIVLDKEVPPTSNASSTDISKIVRLDYGSSIEYTHLAELAIGKWRMLRIRNPGLFHECGILYLTSESVAQSPFENESRDMSQKRGHSSIISLDGNMEELYSRFPGWSGASGFTDAMYNAQGGWVQATRYIEYLADQALKIGISLVSGKRGTVHSIIYNDDDGNRVTG